MRTVKFKIREKFQEIDKKDCAEYIKKLKKKEKSVKIEDNGKEIIIKLK